MISTLTIEGFRCFERLEMGGLGRVNLIVGKNNSGKTSVLEALYLAESRRRGTAIAYVLWRRGERSNGGSVPEFDTRSLFTGRGNGAQFTVGTGNGASQRTIKFSLRRVMKANSASGGSAEIVVESSDSPTAVETISSDDLSRLQFERPEASVDSQDDEEREKTALMGPELVSGLRLIEMWDNVALTETETLVLSSLRSLDSSIERIAPQIAARKHFSSTRGGFLVKRTGQSHPIPIGSEGDGVWRMLALAIFIAQAKGGTLLVDEIDTGLHHRAMADMWKLVLQAARDTNVQIFATTHSRDCVQSLADVLDARGTIEGVSLQRLEAGKRKSVAFSEKQIRLLADDWVETR